jgi:hypothetical protein
MAAVGCGADDDDDTSGGRGGTGGSAGSSGKAGKGGAAGKGGTAGTSNGGKGGKSGTAGRAGSGGTGATSGEGGMGGQAGGGEGGAVGGEAGASAGQAGAGGAGATAGEGGAGGASGEAGGGGAGGDAPVETANFCSYGCETSEDCSSSTVFGYECHPTRKRCEDPVTSCDVAEDCYAFASFLWFMPCADDSECTPDLEVCVKVRDGGSCAELPFEGTCSSDQEILTLARFGAEGTVEACGEGGVYCDASNTCAYGCATNDDCTTGLGMGATCNPATHQCGCSDSSECTGAGVSVCNPTTQQCECANDGDCAAIPNRPSCVAGVCSCSDAATDCETSPFPGAAEATCR